MTCARCSTGCATSLRRERRGGGCRTICRPGRRCTSRRSAGWRRAASRRWSMICGRFCDWRRGAQPSRPPRSSTAGRCGPRPRAASAPAMTGARLSRACRGAQEGLEDPHGRRYAGSPAGAPRHAGQRGGSRRGGAPGAYRAGRDRRRRRACLGRSGLYRRARRQRRCKTPHRSRSRQAARSQTWFRPPAATLGRRTVICVGHTLPTPRQRLRTLCRNTRRTSRRCLRLPYDEAGHRHRYRFITASRGSLVS